MSPIHFAFMHHDENCSKHYSKTATISVPEKHCNYCDFHFFHFINDVNLYKGSTYIRHFFNTKPQGAVSFYTPSYTNKSVLGRAPPQIHTIYA